MREADRGAAAERTALAWARSALTLATIGALFLRFGAESRLPLLGYPTGVLLLLAGALLWLLGSAGGGTELDALLEGRIAPREWVLGAITAATTVIAAVALAFALLS